MKTKPFQRKRNPISVKIDPELHKAIKMFCAKQDYYISIQEFVEEAIQEKLEVVK